MLTTSIDKKIDKLHKQSTEAVSVFQRTIDNLQETNRELEIARQDAVAKQEESLEQAKAHGDTANRASRKIAENEALISKIKSNLL